MDFMVLPASPNWLLDLPSRCRILALLAHDRRTVCNDSRLAITLVTEISQSTTTHLARKFEFPALLDTWPPDTECAQLDALWLAQTDLLLHQEARWKRRPDVGANTIPRQLGLRYRIANILPHPPRHRALVESRNRSLVRLGN